MTSNNELFSPDRGTRFSPAHAGLPLINRGKSFRIHIQVILLHLVKEFTYLPKIIFLYYITNKMEQKIIAGFFTLKEEHYDYLEETLQMYDIGNYLIGFEITPDNKKKEHFHVLFEGTDQIWNNFSKKVVGDHKLRGTGKGNKKYGKVKEIRDIEKMCSYTIKEGNFRGNFPEEDIKRWYDKSFSKNHKVETRDKILQALADHKYQNINSLRLKAIEVLADIGDNHRPTKSSVESLVIEHYSRTGQHKRIFSMLYPCEKPPFILEDSNLYTNHL